MSSPPARVPSRPPALYAYRHIEHFCARICTLTEALQASQLGAIDYEAWSMARCQTSLDVSATPLDGAEELQQLQQLLRDARTVVYERHPEHAEVMWEVWEAQRLRGVSLRAMDGVARSTAARWRNVVDALVWAEVESWGWALERRASEPDVRVVRVAWEEGEDG